jgi:hypothetical protein
MFKTCIRDCGKPANLFCQIGRQRALLVGQQRGPERAEGRKVRLAALVVRGPEDAEEGVPLGGRQSVCVTRRRGLRRRTWSSMIFSASSSLAKNVLK